IAQVQSLGVRRQGLGPSILMRRPTSRPLHLFREAAGLLRRYVKDAIPESSMTNPQSHKLIPVALVVDDSLTMRMLMREALEQGGFAVEEAEDGASAIALFSHIQPDVVLLDVRMPGLDGFSTC